MNPLLHDRIGQVVACGAAVTVRKEIAGLDRMLPLVLAAPPWDHRSERHPGESGRRGGLPAFHRPGPYIGRRLVWRRDDNGAAVAELVGVVRELRGEGAFLAPTWMADVAGAGRRVGG